MINVVCDVDITRNLMIILYGPINEIVKKEILKLTVKCHRTSQNK